jgi:hypothetical protein
MTVTILSSLRFKFLPFLLSSQNFGILSLLRATFVVHKLGISESRHLTPPPSKKVFFSLTSHFSGQTFDKICPGTDKRCFRCQAVGFTIGQTGRHFNVVLWKKKKDSPCVTIFRTLTEDPIAQQSQQSSEESLPDILCRGRDKRVSHQTTRSRKYSPTPPQPPSRNAF